MRLFITGKSRILNILFWSVISAAFIGPGTITTAAKAGATHSYSLLWALVFSIVACLLLQEASARITIASGKNLGQAIAAKFKNSSIRLLVLLLVIGAIILGSAAYQTGNLLGAVAGISLITNLPTVFIILTSGLLVAIFLNFPSIKFIARFLGFIVVIMGFSFLTTAIMLKPPVTGILKGSFIPDLPDGSALLILGLIGTTVVPYNLFLGSGIADRKQKIREMRFGLSIAVIFGGIISMAVLVVGSEITDTFSFQSLADTLTKKLGTNALYVFSIGLFAAGFSSAMTAPLASAITAQSLFSDKSPQKWKNSSFRFKFVWVLVLVTGLSFGSAGFKPIPAIIIAQALNGLILPFISIFLLFVVNDPKLMKTHINNGMTNFLMGLVVWITLILGVTNIVKALNNAFNFSALEDTNLLVLITIFSFILTSGILFIIYKKTVVSD